MLNSEEWYTDIFSDTIETPTGKCGKTKFKLVDDAIWNSKYFVSLTLSYPNIINNRNIVCYSDDADLLWQVEDIKETSFSKYCRYVEFRGFAEDESIVRAFNWNHWLVGIDIQTGKIVEKVNTLPDWQVDGNTIVCPNGKTVVLPFEVMSYDKVENGLLVLVQPPPKVLMPDNVFMISDNGTITWQIEKNGTTDRDVSGYYIYYDFPVTNGQLRMITLSGFIMHVDPENGKVLDIMWAK